MSSSSEALGPHTTAIGGVYVKNLDKMDLSVLESNIAESYQTLSWRHKHYAPAGRRPPRVMRRNDLLVIVGRREYSGNRSQTNFSVADTPGPKSPKFHDPMFARPFC